MEAAGALDQATLSLVDDGEIPRVALTLDEKRAGMSAFDVLLALEGGSPSVRPGNGMLDRAELSFNPQCLEPDDPAKIGRRLREIFQ